MILEHVYLTFHFDVIIETFQPCPSLNPQLTKCLFFNILSSSVDFKTTYQFDNLLYMQHVHKCDLREIDFYSKFLANLQFITTYKIINSYNQLSSLIILHKIMAQFELITHKFLD